MQIDLVKNRVGTRCMILSKSNQLLFFGRVAYCDVVNKTIRVNGDCPYVRQFLKPDDWAKLNIKEGEGASRFILAEGVVEQVINNYFVLEPRLIIEKSDEREYFRQLVMRTAEIALVNGKESKAPCLIMDISVTGISFRSNQVYQIGDCLWVNNQQIREGGATHNLEFVVVRQQELETGPYRYFYGCKFANLSTETQDKLCCDIFALQAARLHAVRDK